jgi:hypothetical protein
MARFQTHPQFDQRMKMEVVVIMQQRIGKMTLLAMKK